MTRYSEADPDTDASRFEKAAAAAEEQAPESAYPGGRNRRPVRILTLAELLEFENETAGRPRTKQGLIRERFALTPTSYYQQLNHHIDTTEGLEADPVLINRLRQQRAKELAWRTSRTFTR